jgi:stearoyl-CoA 9-desaturase NADPH oxidoreductase
MWFHDVMLRAIRLLTTPLLPEDFLCLVNPLWSTTQPRGKVVDVRRETARASTLRIRPGLRWAGHAAGQYVRVGVDIDGVRHWRSYSLTSPPDRADGCIEVTVQAQPGGLVSTHLAHATPVGTIVHLAPAEGAFVLPTPTPRRLLLITAGSGITPVMAMLRELSRRGPLPDTVLLHCAPSLGEMIFRNELLALSERHPGLRLRLRATTTEGRFALADLPALCPDWSARDAFACGPDGLLADAERHWSEHPGRLRTERFAAPIQPVSGRDQGGGLVRYGTGDPVEVDGSTSLLSAGEAAGTLLPSGCRMGICFGCVLPLREGQVRDLRTGQVHGEPGELVQTCISGASGSARLELPAN